MNKYATTPSKRATFLVILYICLTVLMAFTVFGLVSVPVLIIAVVLAYKVCNRTQ